MTILTTAVPITISRGGNYPFQIDLGSGSVSIQLSMGGQVFKEITGCNYTADADGTLDLPDNCQIQAVFTNAVVDIERNSG